MKTKATNEFPEIEWEITNDRIYGDIDERIIGLGASIRKAKISLVIIVSNEVGEGIVPGDPLSRRFRDLVGLANQVMAAKADEVIMMKVGVPVRIKPFDRLRVLS